MFEDYRKGTFKDYKDEVLNAYREHGIKMGLEDPKPKKLREYSLYVYANRFSKEDQQILKLFFDPDNEYNDLEKAIKSIELDKIKPLIRFMNGATKETEDKNVKLLAWLINFDSYDKWRRNKAEYGEKLIDESVEELDWIEEEDSAFIGDTEEDVETEISSEITDGMISKNDTSQESTNSGNENKDEEQISLDSAEPLIKISQTEETNRPLQPKLAYKQWVLYTVIAFAMAIGIYLFAIGRNHGCMFWANDHYQPISCKEKIKDVTIIALDEDKVDQLKKITLPDTLTERALGKVWYVKMTVDSLEFYTAGGFHPIYTAKKLKPLTGYILERYIQNKQPADSLGK